MSHLSSTVKMLYKAKFYFVILDIRLNECFEKVYIPVEKVAPYFLFIITNFFSIVYLNELHEEIERLQRM